jgi:malate dehydrogenase (quinone)
MDSEVDVLLVGAGAMSTTLAVMLQELDPNLKMMMVERLNHVASESTDGLNNAGTGHAAYCELNYTPRQADGSINCSKAFSINECFEISLQFWSYLVNKGALPHPKKFINTTPHCSFVWGEDNVDFLRKRHQALSQHPLFDAMEYSEDPEQIREWMPLVMDNRQDNQPIAATRVRYGSDVNFGELARFMVNFLEVSGNFELKLSSTVQDLKQEEDGRWCVKLKHSAKPDTYKVRAKFVFLGAGGGALPLLQKSGIPEGEGYGGFPVSGQWLICKNKEVIERHQAKVYGMAPIGAPPMSVPHLDTRIINGEKALLFGPFAGFTTKFLKNGSLMDLPMSLSPDNLMPMMSVARNNMDLTKYLISEVMQTHGSRVESLRNFFPEAEENDWELSFAGQRVQIIKPGNETKGKLEFGTEVISAADGSIAALLGASPGASTATSTMISIIEECFAERMQKSNWAEKLKQMIPSYGESLATNSDLLRSVRAQTLDTLQLDEKRDSQAA